MPLIEKLISCKTGIASVSLNGHKMYIHDIQSNFHDFQILCSVLVQVYRRKGQYTSALLWFFWMFAMLANLLEAYAHIKDRKSVV